MEIAVHTKQVRLRTPSCPKLFLLSSIFYENSRSILHNLRSTQHTPLADTHNIFMFNFYEYNKNKYPRRVNH